MTAFLGSTRPRLFTPPLAAGEDGLPVSSKGWDFIRFARAFGEPLWPWQEEAAIRGLELTEDGSYRFRLVLVLAARQNGKTRFMRLLSLWRLFEQDVRLVVSAAQDRARAFEVWEDALEAIEAHPEYGKRLGKVWRRTNAEYFRVLDSDGRPAGRYTIKAATRSSGRGPSADHVNFDELREQTDWAGWSALSKTIMAKADGQLWAFSNAGDLKAVVLRHLRSVALAGSEPTIGVLEWSALQGCALDDPAGWAAANPSLGRPGGITEAAIRTGLAGDPPEIFRTEVLCQFVDVMSHAVDAEAFAQLADPSLDDKRRDWVACVDVATDSAHVTLALAAVMSDGRVRGEIAGAWGSMDQARRELPALLDEIDPVHTGWFPSGPCKPLAPLLRHLPGQVEIKGSAVSEACMGFADLVESRLFLHRDDPLMTAHVTGSTKLKDGEGWRFARLGDAHCDAAYAVAGATYLALSKQDAEIEPEVMWA
jgi:hypothetical protein